ncbi:MAG: hypothetical protein AABZ06_00770 [Bdellovibrionota bacterium]
MMQKSFGYFSFSGLGQLPRLSTDDPAGPFAYSTGLTVKRGDVLNYSGNGSWGGTSADFHSWLGGFITVTTWKNDCSEISITGHDDDGALISYLGMPAGLLGSDGSEVFLLGANLSNKTINNDGVLRFGFNTPVSNSSCARVTITRLSITHCEDSSGATFSCN